MYLYDLYAEYQGPRQIMWQHHGPNVASKSSIHHTFVRNGQRGKILVLDSIPLLLSGTPNGNMSRWIVHARMLLPV